MKTLPGLVATALLMTAPAMAADYNTDSQPSPEVAPGIYGKMSTEVTSKFKLAIGGYIKLDYAYNSVNLGNNGVISPSSGAIPSKAFNPDPAKANPANQ